ncbi:MAG: ABC transporter permease [Pseudobutyrivibrio sp.]|nr:ABC transporter permease [Pseudobutyrivibrio sp.]
MFSKYLLLQLKRITKLLPGILALNLAVAALMAAIAYGLISNSAYQLDSQRYRLGLVGSTDQELLKLGIQGIQSMDQSKYMIELVDYRDEDRAKSAMRHGKISAYVVITPEFLDSIDSMKNDSKITYYATSGQKGISNVMMDEVASAVSHLVVYSEKGICSLREYMGQVSVNAIFMTYINSILARTNVATIESLGLSDGLSTPAYYIIGISLFFMLLISFCSISFFIGHDRARTLFFRAKGLAAWLQVLAEYLAFFAINLISLGLIIVLVILVIAFNSQGFSHITGMNPGEFIGLTLGQSSVITIMFKLAFGLLPVLAMMSALGFFVFEAIQGLINKILVAFMLFIGMSYVSGYFYPKAFFPARVQTIGECLPTGVAFSYLKNVALGDNSDLSLLWMMAYLLGFLLLATCIRRSKIR